MSVRKKTVTVAARRSVAEAPTASAALSAPKPFHRRRPTAVKSVEPETKVLATVAIRPKEPAGKSVPREQSAQSVRTAVHFAADQLHSDAVESSRHMVSLLSIEAVSASSFPFNAET